MQVKKLTIHNLASLADAEINFGEGKLSEAPIFLISGETGSGKSTILDAICLALYNRTPRMMSVTREEIAAFEYDDKRFFTNDNSQLLRRGTGEGFVKLTFTGNDGKEYEATWEIQRNYKLPDRPLQKARRTLSATDGSYSENNLRPIELKIQELIGLDYDQFCRTVMLAQGEFTKFIKSARNEKSEILEKLTGTRIYSEIGKRIAERYLDKRGKWEEVSNRLKGLVVLSQPERQEKEGDLEVLEKASVANGEKRGEVDKKLKWIEKKRGVDDQIGALRKRREGIVAMMESTDFVADKSLVADFRRTERLRLLISQKEKSLKSCGKSRVALNAIDKKVAEVTESFEAKQKKIAEQEGKIKAKTEEFEGFGIDDLGKRLFDLTSRDIILSGLRNVIVNYKSNLIQLSELTSDLEAKKKHDADWRKESSEVEIMLKDAEVRTKECGKRLEKIQLSSSEAASELRHVLSEGDVCPVCGQTVHTVLTDKYLNSILDPLRKEKEEADAEYNMLIARKTTLGHLREAVAKEISGLGNKIKKCTSEHGELLISLTDMISEAGYSGEYAAKDVMQDNLADKFLTSIEDEQEKLKTEIGEVRKKQTYAEAVNAELKKLREDIEGIRKEADCIRAERDKCATAAAECSASIKIEEEKIAELENEIRGFYQEEDALSEARVNELLKVKEKQIKKIEEDMASATEELSKISGGLEQLEAQLKLVETDKPELLESDTEEWLREKIQELDEIIRDQNRKIGQLKERLSADDEARKAFEKVRTEEESARQEKERWESLYRLLGDKDGAKFRNVAQSYILKSLLDKANRYMNCFTDRYTLACNPGSLAILVVDSFKPADPQPASILSGGESFMASLSLALALSNLNGSGIGVDIIFIDEGFGTLSAKYLGNVMDTLEILHRIGGRRVGLISHVPEMKERIPVHVEVTRESPALSRVAVTSRLD